MITKVIGNTIVQDDGTRIHNLTKTCFDLVTLRRYIDAAYEKETSVLFIHAREFNKEIFGALMPLLGPKWTFKEKVHFLKQGYFVSKGKACYIGISLDGNFDLLKAVKLQIVCEEE